MEIVKRIIAIGGGELKSKETLEIDRYIATLARERAGENRPYGLFIGTASHDSMPYFNSFRKTYTSVFDIKADVALTVYGEMDLEKIKGKFEKADFIYVGGGDTLYMLKRWQEFGLFDLIRDAYERGVIICGLSAGAICWFEDIYTDSELVEREEKQMLRAALERLAPREKLIIELRFGFGGREELTQKEVADLLGISQSYISRLEKKIIAELREEIAGKI